MSELDHLVVAAQSLEEGAAWIERKLGVTPVAGGTHAAMGTHNRLLGLGEALYLEVIAIDPCAGAIGRARWFALDSREMRARLRRGPALIHWVVRTDDLERHVRELREPLEILAMARGEYRWRIAVAGDGHLPARGAKPTPIQWVGRHPAHHLPESGCRLVRFAHDGSLAATIATPRGLRRIVSRRVRFAE